MVLLNTFDSFVQLCSNILVLALTTGVFILLIFLRKWKIRTLEEVPHVYYKSNSRNECLSDRCKAFRIPFRPPWWALNGHIQTILPEFVGHVHVDYVRETVELADGGMVALDWVTSVSHKSFDVQNCPTIVLVIPGLTGAVNGYGRLYEQAFHHRMVPVVFNKRGHGNLKISTPKLQSFGDSSDLRECIVHITTKYPSKLLTSIGYSAGSGLLVCYLGDYPDNSLIDAAVYNSPGYDCNKIYAHKGVCQPYNAILTQALKTKIISPNSNMLSKVIDIKAVLNARNLRQIEERLYCRLYGFENIDAYFSENNPTRVQMNVKTPSLSISSLDDPICRKENIPYEYFRMHDYSLLAVTNRGGHCGWTESGSHRSWADMLALEFIATVTEYKSTEGDDYSPLTANNANVVVHV